ncbi:hypothetical protein [Gracilimonas sp.]|uniref:hypothetical protein n=1 Tax=Gracilimonas sp. TaxID=1974203 RepID=UPI003BAB26E8
MSISERIIELNDNYVELYNSMSDFDDRLKLVSNFSSILSNVERKRDRLREEVEELHIVVKRPLLRLIDEVESKISESEYVNRVHDFISDFETSTKYHSGLNTYGKNIDEYHQEVVDFVDEVGGLEVSKSFFTAWKNSLREYFESFKEVIWIDFHIDSLDRIIREIIVNNYPEELIKYSRRSEEEKAKLIEPGSGSDQLHIAYDWLPDIIRKIGRLEEPTHEEVENVIKDKFENLKLSDIDPSINFIWGKKVSKRAVNRVLTHLFNEKYPRNQISDTPGNNTITKRADALGWW